MVDFLFANSAGVTLFSFRTDAPKLTQMDTFTILDITGATTDAEKALVQQAYKQGLSYTLAELKAFAVANSLNMVAFEQGGAYGTQGIQQMPLATVGTVTPTVDSATQITLDWTGITNAAGYIVERATNAGFTTGLTSTTIYGNTPTLVVTGLTTATAYYFRVTAVASIQAFGYTNSAAASATATATTS